VKLSERLHLEHDNLDKDGIELIQKMFSKRDDREAELIRCLCRHLIAKEQMIARYREAFEQHNCHWFHKHGPK